jgi:adenine-specific DNA-methyltransferase
MRYIGNKTKLLDFIHSEVRNVCGDISSMRFCDLFAGSGSVSKYFKQYVQEVSSNDLEQYSYVLCSNYVGNLSSLDCSDLIQHLNDIPNVEGKFYRNFSPAGNRNFFTEYNAQRIDAIRQEIERLISNNEINLDQYYFLLASLIETADSYANTTGVYGAFLKQFGGRSSKNLILVPAQPALGNRGFAYRNDANELIKTISGDILYLDPPYNTRQYGSNYHILNYLVDYDNFQFNQESKTGLGHYNKSDYSSKRSVSESFEQLIHDSNFKYIFVSYNNEGILSMEQMKSIMSKYGEYQLKTKDHKRYKSNINIPQQSKVLEYLHVLTK